jgi:transcriptional regulator with XRE-family HTH domain
MAWTAKLSGSRLATRRLAVATCRVASADASKGVGGTAEPGPIVEVSMVQGRKPNIARRREAASLRRQGLSVADVGRRMGISRQAAHQLLVDSNGDSYPVTCRQCDAVIIWSAVGMGGVGNQPWCTTCLASHPDASFADRLKSLRLARGMSHADLAHAAGVNRGTISRFERGESAHPKWPLLVRLVRILGPLLVGWNVGQELQ